MSNVLHRCDEGRPGYIRRRPRMKFCQLKSLPNTTQTDPNKAGNASASCPAEAVFSNRNRPGRGHAPPEKEAPASTAPLDIARRRRCAWLRVIEAIADMRDALHHRIWREDPDDTHLQSRPAKRGASLRVRSSDFLGSRRCSDGTPSQG